MKFYVNKNESSGLASMRYIVQIAHGCLTQRTESTWASFIPLRRLFRKHASITIA